MEPLRFDNGFVLPDKLNEGEKIDVRVAFKGYDLSFESVPANAFNYDWVISVDRKPFDSDNTDPTEKPPPGKKLALIYYIHYVARTKEQADTKTIIKVYK